MSKKIYVWYKKEEINIFSRLLLAKVMSGSRQYFSKKKLKGLGLLVEVSGVQRLQRFSFISIL